MKIVFYTGYHHIPWDPTTPGLGGSETAVAYIAKHLVEYGHTVLVVGYVNRGEYGGVFYCPTSDFHEYVKTTSTPVDTLIGVNYIHFLDEVGYINARQNIFWIHNTEHFPYHNGELMDNNGDHVYLDTRLSAVVCVSKWQADLMTEMYPGIGEKVYVIENGISPSIINPNKDIRSKKNRFIYSSAADRGLDTVLDIWPNIKSKYLDAELVVCTPSYALGEFNERIQRMEMLGVTIKGSLTKSDLYKEIISSEFWLYPSKYEETFCITALEMLCGGCIPITTDVANLQYLVPPSRGFITPSELQGSEFDNHVMRRVDEAINMNDEDKRLLVESNIEWAYHQTWFNRAREWHSFIKPKTVKELIERIFIISLDPQNPDNKQRWEQQLEAAGLSDIPCELIQAINGNDVNEHYLQERDIKLFDWKIDHTNDWWNRDIKPGEIGCALSHYGAWKLIHSRGYKGALILEEDMLCVNEFTDDIAKSVPCNWDMLYLGRNPLRPDRHRVNDNVVIPDASYNTHAYALSASGVKKLIDQNFTKSIMPVDEFLICTYTQHDREDLHHIWSDSLVYAVSPDIFNQSSNGHTSMTESIHLYGKLHPELYTYFDDREEWCKRFLSPGVMSKEWELLYDEPIDGVVCLPFFTEEFCDLIAEEADHLNQWTTDRHEFYPTTDILLEKIGFNDIFNDLLQQYVMPLAIHHFGLEGEGWDCMSCENFLARYRPDAQGQLSVHHDASDITALVNLSQPDVDFQGGGTWFARQKKLYRPQKGSLSVHPGNITHKHGARAVTKGQRHIMVSFMRNVKKYF